MEGRGVLVWGGIMLGSRTDLHIFDVGFSQRDPCVTRFFFHICVFLEALWGQTLGSSYLTTSNDSGASIGAAETNGQQCFNNSLTPSFSAWADAVKPAYQSGEIISLLKTGCFLLDTHHRDVSAFSRIVLHATFR
ncbi:hypothetical protein TNCV_4764271 [Trichonephila clavipes]|nr:hypothetical protein TNCV_4764271 [Trichonephila clavipes]